MQPSDTAVLEIKPNRRRLLTGILSFILPLVIVILLLRQVSWAEAIVLLHDVTPSWIALGVVFYLITNIVRAYRMRTLLPDYQLHMSQIGSIAIAQSMFNNVLPARVGEVAFVYLLNKHEHVAIDRATVALIVARVADYLAVAMFFILAALLILSDLPPVTTTIIVLVLIGMLAVVVLLLWLAWLGPRSLQIVRWILHKLRLEQLRLVIWSVEKIEQLVTSFQKTQSPQQLMRVFAWSLLVWGFTFAWFFAFLAGVGIHTGASILIVGATFAILSKAIPFLSIGGLGAHEAGWTVGFVLVGFDTTTAVLSGFAVNILTLIVSVVLSIVALAALRLHANPKPGFPS